jgi:hypothetical protein
VRSLHQAVEAEFAADPVRLQTGRALVELASGRGQPAVSALVALDRMVEAGRNGRATPVHTGAITVDDEIRELVEELSRCGCPCHAAGHDREVWSGDGAASVG